ncbi:hypothetical protein KFE98_18950 [bacterium SCSIO 12741]|nr:hypothetical protein KFE98_18950 [bacterium SCSIO 12741]
MIDRIVKSFSGSVLILLALFFLQSCQGDGGEDTKDNYLELKPELIEEPVENPKEIPVLVEKSIEYYGGEAFENFSFGFHFRDKWYSISEEKGVFKYIRSFVNEDGEKIEDELSNTGFSRNLNGNPVELDAQKQAAYTASVNSVAYFMLLPYRLTDRATQFKPLGPDTLKGVVYERMGVTFAQEGGGEDHQDKFMFWINPENYRMDYLAYSYETNGGGIRFREAIKQHHLSNGMILQDYLNFKCEDLTLPLENLGREFEKGNLKEVSRIEAASIRVIY